MNHKSLSWFRKSSLLSGRRTGKFCAAISALLYCTLLPAGEFTFSLAEVNKQPGDWLGLDESQVYFRTLTHKEEGHDWSIKIGKGGQIYSIKIPGQGELIALQRADYGQWMDEVFQHTIPMPPEKSTRNNVVDGDIHQAGYYAHSDLDRGGQLLARSVYSPLFAFRHDLQANSVSYTTWPQHAHLPRWYAENLMVMNQTITDRGAGVIEISIEIDKWGGARNEKFGLPWAAFRTSAVPVHIIGEPDGGYRDVTQRFRGDKKPRRLVRNDSGGWIAFVERNAPGAKGIGIVFGKTAGAFDGPFGYVRWGNYGPQSKSGIDGTVATVKRDVPLDAGEALYYRYFVVLGTLKHIQSRANELESQVVLKKIDTRPRLGGRLAVCATAGALTRDCPPGGRPLFYSLPDFVGGARPLFLLKMTRTAQYLLTDNPYEISFDPTDGATEYVDFLGWAMPVKASDDCADLELKSVLNRGVRAGKDAGMLRVFGRPACSNGGGGSEVPAPG